MFAVDRFRARCSFPDMGEPPSNESPLILLVDDDPDVLTSARVLLTRSGYRVLTAASPAEAWSVLAAERVDVVLLDLNFTRGATSGAEGFQWLAELKAQDPDAVVVVVTGHSGINVAVAAMKAGASDFVMKPWSNARLTDTVRDAVALRRRRRRGEAAAVDEEALIIGDSPPVQTVRDLIGRAAPTGAAVLAHGPAGSGKTLAARVIHARSGRTGALVRLDARDLTPDGAAAAVRQAAAEATGGTLVLEEVAALPGPAQTALLGLLDEGADVRLVSTARAPPADLRDELRDRLGTVELVLPPLAERGEDALLLAEHFVRLFSRRYGKAPKPLDAMAIDALKARPPAGEVRGLRQACERAVVLSTGDVLGAADFAPSQPAAAGAPAADLNLARSEKAIVEAALKRHAHNVSHAARELGLTRAALYRRMVKHGL
jgi:DNA-binding NtrC family response regulator